MLLLLLSITTPMLSWDPPSKPTAITGSLEPMAYHLRQYPCAGGTSTGEMYFFVERILTLKNAFSKRTLLLQGLAIINLGNNLFTIPRPGIVSSSPLSMEPSKIGPNCSRFDLGWKYPLHCWWHFWCRVSLQRIVLLWAMIALPAASLFLSELSSPSPYPMSDAPGRVSIMSSFGEDLCPSTHCFENFWHLFLRFCLDVALLPFERGFNLITIIIIQ